MENCLICNKNRSNYKCPKCRIKYCSADCFKEHQKTDCSLKTDCDAEQEETKNNTSITKDTIPEHKLKLLENDDKLQNILKNKHVRDILLEIDKSKDPAGIMDKAMIEPIFTEFADACLKIVQNESSS